MIRTALLFFYVLGLGVYARRDWFVSLCGALLLMGVIRHPDMPRTIAGIQGLSPWNILMLCVLLSWLILRKDRGLEWDMPPAARRLLLLYGVVVGAAFLRMIVDPQNLERMTTTYLVSEYLINSVKWVLPGLILYDTCRTRKQIAIALLAILGIYLILSLQVIKRMPLSSAVSGNALSSRAAKVLENDVGYHRVNLSMMLAGGSWAIVAGTLLFKRWKIRILMLGGAAAVTLGMALTGGRTGQLTWAALGIVLGLIRWRRALPLIPVVAIIVLTFLPAVSERLFQGFGSRQGTTEVESNEYEITSGRNLIWPYVIAEIKKAPLFGHGRLAMNRIGLDRFFAEKLNEDFSHPHNAYLELLLDTGLVGFFLVIPFYVLIVWRSLPLFTDRSDNLAAATGGITLALVLALLIAALGSQTFYPREGSVGMWAAIGVMLRVSVEKRKTVAGGLAFDDGQDAIGDSAIAKEVSSRPRPRVGLAVRRGSAKAPRLRVEGPAAPDSPSATWSRTRLRTGEPSGTRRTVRTTARKS